MVLLYDFVSKWVLSHKFFGPTLSRLIFSGSDTVTYRRLFHLVNFDVKLHQRHADFYTKVLIKKWSDFDFFYLALLETQKPSLMTKYTKNVFKRQNTEIET